MRTVTLLVDDSVTDAQLRERLNGLEVEWPKGNAATGSPETNWKRLCPAEQAGILEAVAQVQQGDTIAWEDVEKELTELLREA